MECEGETVGKHGLRNVLDVTGSDVATALEDGASVADL